jgi:hypothetical protein
MYSMQRRGTDHYVIQIATNIGQVIFDRVMEGSGSQIDLSSLQEGIYLITIRSKNSAIRKKMVKL